LIFTPFTWDGRGTDACVTVTVLPAAVIVPVRAAPLLLRDSE